MVTFFLITTIPTTTIDNAIIVTTNICIINKCSFSLPVGGVNVTNSVALESLSTNAPLNSPSFGLALPAVTVTSLLPTEFSNLTISAMLSNVKLSASSCADTTYVIVNAICDL